MYVEAPFSSTNRTHEVKPSSYSSVYHAGPVMSTLPSNSVLYITIEAHVSTLAKVILCTDIISP